MDEYRKYVDEIHAPESLINTTLERVHLEQQTGEGAGVDKKHKAGNIIKFATPVVAAAAVAVLVVTQLPQKNMLIYNSVPDTAFRTGNILIDFGTFTDGKTITAEEYSEYLGINLDELINGMELVNTDIEISYDIKGKNIVSDEGTLYYESEEGSIIVELSKTKDIVPKVLRSTEESMVDGYSLWVAESDQNDTLIAAGKKDNISYYIRAERVPKKQFEKVLKGLINIL